MTISRSPIPEEFRSNAAAQVRATALDAASQPPTRSGAIPLPENFVPFETPGFITKPQWDFICDLLNKKDLLKSPGFFDAVNAMDAEEYTAYLANLKEDMKRTTRGKASDVITALKALPLKPIGTEPTQVVSGTFVVPPGRYALRFEDDELNPVRFYKVNEGRGKWAGVIFVDRFASDDSFPVKGTARREVLERIAADPLAAASLYGQEFERCSICNRGLTRRLSREMGIGPICATKHGFVESGYVESVEAAIIARGEDPKEKMPTKLSAHIIDED